MSLRDAITETLKGNEPLADAVLAAIRQYYDGHPERVSYTALAAAQDEYRKAYAWPQILAAALSRQE